MNLRSFFCRLAHIARKNIGRRGLLPVASHRTVFSRAKPLTCLGCAHGQRSRPEPTGAL